MNKKFELLREAVGCYKANHCDGNKNEKSLLQFIDELEQLTIPVVVGSYKKMTYVELSELRKQKIEDVKLLDKVMKDLCACVGRYTVTTEKYKP